MLIHQRTLMPSLCSGPHYFKILPGFPYNLLPISCGDIGFKRSKINYWHGKQNHKVSLMPCGPPCPLQAVLLGDLAADCNGRLALFFKS
jgi:hypothetical protein